MIAMASALFAAGSAEGSASGAQTLVIAAKDDWSTFDPYYQISISNRIYNPMLFESLIVVLHQVTNLRVEPLLFIRVVQHVY